MIYTRVLSARPLLGGLSSFRVSFISVYKSISLMSPYSKPHPFEEKMRSIQFTPLNFPHKTSKAALTGRWKTKTKSPEYDPQPSAPPLEHPPSPEPYLPPLQKIQGPFKHPEELRRLKSKPTRPTLRMETPYYSQDMRR